MSLAKYLADRYLTSDNAQPKKSKKRKRKEPSQNSGIVIEDDTSLAWNGDNVEASNENEPLVVSGNTGEFRSVKKSNWASAHSSDAVKSEQQKQDGVLPSNAAEKTGQEISIQEEDAPQIVGSDVQEVDILSLNRDSGRKKREGKHKTSDPDVSSAQQQETVYRDASGRIINLAMKRAEVQRQAEEEQKKTERDKEMLRGDVQRIERGERAQELADAKYATVARYADDAQLNEELKEDARWNDPAAGFLTKKTTKTSKTGRPLYKGSFAPNRYGIRPGHRWDGVDRSNGFEEEYFKAKNRRQNLKDLHYAWQMDD